MDSASRGAASLDSSRACESRGSMNARTRSSETPIEAASTPDRFCPAEAAALPDTRSLEDTGQPAMNGPFEMVEKQPESLDGLG